MLFNERSAQAWRRRRGRTGFSLHQRLKSFLTLPPNFPTVYLSLWSYLFLHFLTLAWCTHLSKAIPFTSPLSLIFQVIFLFLISFFAAPFSNPLHTSPWSPLSALSSSILSCLYPVIVLHSFLCTDSHYTSLLYILFNILQGRPGNNWHWVLWASVPSHHIAEASVHGCHHLFVTGKMTFTGSRSVLKTRRESLSWPFLRDHIHGIRSITDNKKINK